MKPGIEKVYFTAQDPKTFMVMVLDGSVELEPYCMEMMRNNNISSLLPLRERFLNGVSEMVFDISGMTRLSDFMQSVHDAKALRIFLQSICRSLQKLYDFFLHPAQCVMDPDYCFVDDKHNVHFALIPFRGDNLETGESLKQFFSGIVGASPAASDAHNTEILSYLIRPEFLLKDFAALIESSLGEDAVKTNKKSAAVQKKEKTADTAPEKKPDVFAAPKTQDEPAKPDKAVIPEKKPAAMGNIAIPGFEGIAIPGMGDIAIPASEEPKKKQKKSKVKKQKEEKQGSEKKKGLGSLFGKKKENALNLNEEFYKVTGGVAAEPAIPVSPAIPQPDQNDQGDWHGTVQFVDDEDANRTEFLDEEMPGTAMVLTHNGKHIPVTKNPFIIGRENCDYVISSPKVSRHHLTIKSDDSGFLIIDNNSKNHTFINGQMAAPYTPYSVADGTELRLGNEIIMIRIN